MKYLSSIMIGLVLTVWIFVAVKEFRSATKDRGWQRCIRWIAATCMAVGASGFFGTALVAIGALKQLPNSFEWPIGYATGVVTTRDNYFVVPHTPSGRVQIYDSNWRFLRGWRVEAGAGTFKLHITDTNRIHIVTARTRMHYTYDLQGELLSSEIYPATGSGYSSFPTGGRPYLVPTAAWLWVFTSPFYSWLTAAIGLGLFILNEKMKWKTPVGSVPGGAGR
jgi:hypothetical protein